MIHQCVEERFDARGLFRVICRETVRAAGRERAAVRERGAERKAFAVQRAGIRFVKAVPAGKLSAAISAERASISSSDTGRTM